MNVGLNLLGRLRPGASEGVLPRVEAWVHRECAGNLVAVRYENDALGRPFLFLQLHPLSRGTRIVDLGEHRLQVVADTAPVGPGYHVYHCSLLKKLASAFGITWEPGNHELDEVENIFYASLHENGPSAGISKEELEKSIHYLKHHPENHHLSHDEIQKLEETLSHYL